MSTLRAAAAYVRIPTSPEMVIGGGILPMYSQGHEGELRATALIIDADTRVCIVSCDVLAVTRDIADQSARMIEEKCGVPFTNIMITATHSHHSPTTVTVHGYTREEQFTGRLQSAIVEAACDACAQLDGERVPNEQEAEFLYARGWEATVGRNSRFLLRDGSIAWHGHKEEEIVRPTGPFDPEMPIIAFRRPTGELSAGLFVHSNHNIGFREHLCSPGFYGLAAQEAQERHGAPFLYLPGAIGSSHPNGPSVAEKLVRLGSAIDRALEKAQPGLRGPVRCIRAPFTFRVRKFDEASEDTAVRAWCERWFNPADASAVVECFRAMRRELSKRQDEKRETWLQVIRLGEVALVGVPGELFGSLGMAIKERSPFRHTVVVGLANDAIGYIPDAEGFDLGGYQVWTGFHSVVEKGSGEALVDACVDLLHQAANGDTSGEPHIRTLMDGDARRLQKFYNTLDSRGKTLFRPLGWNALLPDMENIVRQARDGVRYDAVAARGDVILGWCFAAGLERDYPIYGIAVSEELRGKGLGTALTERIVEFVRRHGNKGIDLTVVQTNDTARRLYESAGFSVTGTCRGSDGLDYFEMRLDF